jgi:hypothetical protein
MPILIYPPSPMLVRRRKMVIGSKGEHDRDTEAVVRSCVVT